MSMKELATGLKFPEGPVAMDDGSVILVEIAAGIGFDKGLSRLADGSSFRRMIVLVGLRRVGCFPSLCFGLGRVLRL